MLRLKIMLGKFQGEILLAMKSGLHKSRASVRFDMISFFTSVLL